MLTREELLREAAATGFQPEALEKIAHLVELLETLRSHPYLKERIVLKGGTALNLFVFYGPRLCVDIDLNYIGSPILETMLAEWGRRLNTVAPPFRSAWPAPAVSSPTAQAETSPASDYGPASVGNLLSPLARVAQNPHAGQA